MIKSQLIATITAATNLSEKQVVASVNRIFELMVEALFNDQRIEIRDFGSFSLHHRPSRQAHNPKTGEKLITKPKKIPHFKAGKGLRERVNTGRSS